jgi:transcription elongation GreA/GreB family factor
MVSPRTGVEYPGMPGDAGPAAGGASLREQVADALERLSRVLLEYSRETLPIERRSETLLPTEIARIQDTVRFLGQVVAGWGELPEQAIPEEGAGFGSVVVVEDIDRAVRETYTLMTGALLDIDAGQVSLASPIGQALLGVAAGAVVTVHAPQRRRTLRVLSVYTLRDRLDQEAPALAV